MTEIQGEAQIDFPTIWEFKLIGINKEKIEKEIFEVSKKKYEIVFSKMSSGGKYISFNYRIEIENREELQSMYTKLAELESITRVI